ncbi:unnamed protein product [Cochlearia groenlandica]
MLTSSPKNHLHRLSAIVNHIASDDKIEDSLQNHYASAMLALASILFLENGSSAESSVSEMSVPLIPRATKLCYHLRHSAKFNLTKWYGLLDGYDIENTLNRIGLSHVGVIWVVSSIYHCLSGGTLTFRQVLLKTENMKLVACLLTDAHIKLIRNWGGSVSVAASVNGGFILNMGSPGVRVCMEDKDLLKSIEEDMDKYIKVVLEVGVPSLILRSLEHLDSKDLTRPVAFLAKMVGRPRLAIELVSKGLLDPNIMKKLLNSSSPREVILDMLMIISDLSRMDKAFYKYIGEAAVLQPLKELLTHSDPNIRSKACSALGNMCRHNGYFYSSLAEHQIIGLLIDRCTDPDKRTQKFASEDDKTKPNAAGALSNFVRNSNKLCEDIVSKGALQALLKLVRDCSALALNPSKKETISESPLKIALFSLAKMCLNHQICRHFVKSSELFLVIARLKQTHEANFAHYASVIVAKVGGDS